MKKTGFVRVLASLLAAGILAGCSAGQQAGSNATDTIKIAVAAPMTGDNSEYGLGFYDAARLKAQEWNEKGGVLGRQIEILPYDDKNTSEEAVTIAAGMYNLVAPVARQYKQINPDIEIVGFSNAYSQQLLELGKEAVEGVSFPVIFFGDSEDPEIQSYVERYTKAYGNPPSALSSQAYDSVGILLTAISEAGTTDSAAVREKIAQIEYEGVTGTTKFDANGDVDKDFIKVTIKDGKFVRMD